MDRLKEKLVTIFIVVMNEKREFDAFDAKGEELRAVENEIRLKKVKETKPVDDPEQREETRTMADEVRAAFDTEKEIDISDIELRDIGMTNPAAGSNSTVGNLGK
ncbi:MAG: hypothetical protein RSC33_06030 [Vagococcus sp.]